MSEINTLLTIITPNTLFIGKNYIYLDKCVSTNTYILDVLSNKNIAEGTLVLTNHQTNGRGQMGNTWISAPNDSLTFSILLMPKWLKPTQQYYITKLISVTLIQLLNSVKKGFEIKWPNDIYFENKKVAGVLIENSIQNDKLKQSIIGIGLNVNEKQIDIGNGISLFQILENEVDRVKLLQQFCERLEANYLKFMKDFKVFDRLYLDSLYRRGELHWFESGTEKFEGEIIGVSEIGKLKLKSGNDLKEFGIKEVRFLK